MRTIIILILLGLSSVTFSQPTLKGVILKNRLGYQKGDTIKILGYLSANTPKYAVKTKMGSIAFIRHNLIKVNDTINNFWDKQWFENSSADIARHGWNSNIRKNFRLRQSVFHTFLRAEGLLLEDSTINLYLNQLVTLIGPQKIYKDVETRLKVNIIKSDIPEIFSFDDGSIYLTTQLLANTTTEEELIKILTTEISHVVCDHHLKKYKSARNTTIFAAAVVTIAAVATIAAIASNNDSKETRHNHHNNRDYETEGHFLATIINFAPPRSAYIPRNEKTNYTQTQIIKAQHITTAFEKTEKNKVEILTPNEYSQNIAPAITYTAWDLFFKRKYKEALALVNKLEMLNSCSGDDYLLKAKILLYLYTTDEAAYEALKYLQLAKDADNQTNIEIIKEEGIIYLQLKNAEKAKASFEEYKFAIQQLGELNMRDKQEIAWADTMIEKANSLNK